MGKGDKKSKRGKIFSGSYGKSRPRKTKPAFKATAKSVENSVAEEKVTPKETKAPKTKKEPKAKKETKE